MSSLLTLGLESPLGLVRVIMDLLPASVAYVDADLRYVFANKMYLDRVGRSKQEIVGHLVADVTGPPSRHVAHHLRAALQGRLLEPQLVLLRGERVMSVTHLPHRDQQGNVIGVIIFECDITEERYTEASLIRFNQMAVMGRRLASVAFEIHNPLAGVKNLLGQTSQLPDLPSEGHRYIKLANEEVDRISATASQVQLAYRQAQEPRVCKGADLFEAAVSLNQQRIVNGKIRVRERFRSTVEVECFDHEIRHVLSNLVSNAIDAMPSGGTLVLSSRDTSDPVTGFQGVAFTVADSGVGMSQAEQQRLFEPFYTTKGIAGAGLGLWACKEIADRHRGSLRIRTSQRAGASGTVCVLFLPAEGLSLRVRVL